MCPSLSRVSSTAARGKRPLPRSTPDSTGLRSFSFAGVRILDVGQVEALRLLRSWAAKERSSVAVHLCNAYTLVLASRQPRFAETLNRHSANFPDGVPVTWFSKLSSGTRSRGVVRGPSLMRAAFSEPEFRHFFLGGTPELLDALTQEARSINPSINIAGSFAPAFAPITGVEVLEWSARVQDAGANIVWVGLGTPKQDEVVAALAESVDCVLVAVGAAFDFLSGAKPEAPQWIRGSGFEWVHRLIAEPRRLWRRYLVGNELFVYYAARELLRRRAPV